MHQTLYFADAPKTGIRLPQGRGADGVPAEHIIRN